MARPALKNFTLARARPRVRRQLQPDAIRMFYFGQLRGILSRAHALVTEKLLPVIQARLPEAQRMDADKEVDRLLGRLAEQITKDLPSREVNGLVQRVANRTEAFNKDQLIGQIKDATGIQPTLRDANLEGLMHAFATENAALIRSLPSTYFSEVADKVQAAFESGARASTLAADLEERYQVAESRARLIANDQIGKLNGQLNDTRQQEIGIETAEWGTVEDNRVRDSHGELKGQTYRLGEGLIDTQTGERVVPGQAINCRCFGIPDVSALLD